jgi:hypothetical protein
MKKFFILLLLFFICLPVYSATSDNSNNSGWYIYDDSECQNYSKKLHEEYDKKHLKQVGPHEYVYDDMINTYNKEVLIPYLDYSVSHPPKYNK